MSFSHHSKFNNSILLFGSRFNVLVVFAKDVGKHGESVFETYACMWEALLIQLSWRGLLILRGLLLLLVHLVVLLLLL